MNQPLTQSELLKLVSDEELPAFLMELGLSQHLTRDEFHEEASHFPRGVILSAMIAAASSSIHMLSDIVRFLEVNNSKLRTTGFSIALFNNGKDYKYKFGVQATGLLADFHKISLTKKNVIGWSEVLLQWNNELKQWVRGAIVKGEPKFSLSPDVRRSTRRMSQVIEYHGRLEINIDNLAMLIRLWQTLDYLNDKLSATSINRSESIEELSEELSKAGQDIKKMVKKVEKTIKLRGTLRDRKHLDDIRPWHKDWSQEQLFCFEPRQGMEKWEQWTSFIESILLLAEHKIDESAVELLRLDILKDRPRLFEVWLLVRIIDFYRNHGCTILLSSVRIVDNQLIWWLNYARGSTPICEIQSLHSSWKLYYQWFVKGSDGANMPDIALVDGNDNHSQVLWISDPKYSEKRGYSRADYEEVARRYEDAFNANAVWICEYFRRDDIFPKICGTVTKKALVITDAGPKGAGLFEIQKQLSKLHGWKIPFILTIDCSTSFFEQLKQLDARLCALAKISELVVLFADRVHCLSHTELNSSILDYLAHSDIGEGTRAKPLISELKNRASDHLTPPILIIATDRQFSDSSPDLWGEIEQSYSSIRWVTCLKDLLAVTEAIYCN